MKHFTKHSLVVAVAVVMTACASNKGSFDLVAVEPPPKAQNNRPTLQDAPSQPRTQEQLDAMMEPSLGVEVSFLKRNTYRSSTEEQKSFSADSIATISDDFNKLTERQTKELRSKKDRAYAAISGTHDDGGNFFASRKRDYLKFVKSGWIADLEAKTEADYPNQKVYRGPNGFVFYLGKDPATALPTGQVITYKGDWDYATNVVKSRPPYEEFKTDQGVVTGTGDYHSAFSYHESVGNDARLRQAGKHQDGSQPHSHTSEFTVNFDDKTLTGTLKYNKYNSSTKSSTSKDRYTINAKIHGNRFRGSATATDSNDMYFNANSSTLEGGFFGDKAEELAGKFLTDNNNLFAVFGARQTKQDGQYISDNEAAQAQKAFDAVSFNSTTFEKEQLNTFGDATKLVVNGRSFALLPAQDMPKFVTNHRYDLGNNSSLVINVCCDNLNYVKFGNYHIANNEATNNHHVFMTGERTPLSQMLTTGEYEYSGSWEANVLTKGQKVGGVSPIPGQAGSRAKFGVDFGKKTIIGSLYQDNGVAPAVLIKNGVIDGNGFTARFESGPSGFILDRQTGEAARFSGDVAGGFYGPMALELGGYLMSDSNSQDKIHGVFGAKKQVAGN